MNFEDKVPDMHVMAEALVPMRLDRKMTDISSRFNGVQLLAELRKAKETCRDELFRFVDLGCARGRALVQALEVLDREAPMPKRPSMFEILDHYGGGPRIQGRVTAEAIGVDIRKQFETQDDRIQMIEADMMDLPIEDASVHFGWSYDTLRFVEDPLAALEEAHRILKPGGKFFIGCDPFETGMQPPLKEVLAATQGTRDFHLEMDVTRESGLNDRLNYEDPAILVIEKPAIGEFLGFPFEFGRNDLNLKTEADFDAWREFMARISRDPANLDTSFRAFVMGKCPAMRETLFNRKAVYERV